MLYVLLTPSTKDYTNAYQGYVTSEVGTKLQERADKVATCRNTSWTGYWLIVPEALR